MAAITENACYTDALNEHITLDERPGMSNIVYQILYERRLNSFSAF